MRGLRNVATPPTSADTEAIRIGVLAFARVRELLGADRLTLDLPRGARVRDVWTSILEQVPELAPLQPSTRVARNGRVAGSDEAIEDGDELALLPPVGGG